MEASSRTCSVLTKSTRTSLTYSIDAAHKGKRTDLYSLHGNSHAFIADKALLAELHTATMAALNDLHHCYDNNSSNAQHTVAYRLQM